MKLTAETEKRNSRIFETGVCGRIRKAQNVNIYHYGFDNWSPNDFEEIANFTGVLLTLKPLFFEKYSKNDLYKLIGNKIVKLNGVKAVMKQTHEVYGTSYEYLLNDIDEKLMSELAEKFDFITEDTLHI